ncbi:MAG TPA: MurR/RpiR family transcriptional regulator [Kiloniellaceae bacterium]|nr:MurR/RpiR family transcriptional regulator [Kiloniellaceae bacterium]HIP77755.1 MurR/RpiR family transcriptional regulator [Kiloniellaceae bacterium]
MEISFDDFRSQVNDRYDELSPHLQRVARHVLHNPNDIALGTVTQLAEAISVQPSTVIRFCKQFGFSGFSALQQVLRLRLIEGAPELRPRAARRSRSDAAVSRDDPLHAFEDFTKASILSLEEQSAMVRGEDFARAVDMLEQARTVYVIGVRRAFPVASYASYGLARLERRAVFLDFVGGMVPQQARLIGEEDLLFAASYAEYAKPVVEVVMDTYIRGVPILAVTDNPMSPLAKHSSLAFLVHDDANHRLRPLSASINLIQSLIYALSLRLGA